MFNLKYLASVTILSLWSTPAFAVSTSLSLLTDDFPEENSFEIIYEPGVLDQSIAFDSANPSDPGFADGFANTGDIDSSNTSYNFEWDLDPGNYEFNIFDEFEDGLIGEISDGNYTLTTPTESITSPSNGDFGGSETVAFSVSATSVPFEFSPGLGLLTVGGIFGVSRLRKSMKARKNLV